MASFLAGLGGSLIGYSRGQMSADSFTAIVGMTFLAFAYLGGITSVSGAIIAGTLAPLGISYVIMDRAFDLGSSYGVIAGLSLIVTALLNQEGIAGAVRQNVAGLVRCLRLGSSVDKAAAPPVDVGLSMLEGPSLRRRLDRTEFSDRPIVLNAREVTVTFGTVHANDAVSLRVREGEIVGLIGPNGAGKTTFIDAVTGFVPATGTLTIGETDLAGMSAHERSRLGLVRTWQSIELFSDLTVL